jgi:anti-anti-sigma factor
MPSPPASPPPSTTAPPSRQPPLFSCSRTTESGNRVRLVLAGELDLASRPHFKQALSDGLSDAARVVLDLRALTLIDCASLSVIFDAAVEARRTGAVLILLEPRGQVRRVLDLTGTPDGVAVLERTDIEQMAGEARSFAPLASELE